MIYLLLALLSGALLPLQAAINATLRAPLGHPVWAAFASFLIGTMALGVCALGARLPTPATLSGLAPWQWTGGILGAFYLSMTIVLTPRIGAATLFGFVIAGQLLAALVLDHTGWLGVPQHALNAPRVMGALFLLAGVFLIRRF